MTLADPYAPPKHASTPAASTPTGAVQWPVARPFPAVCLKCGGDEAMTTRHVRLSIGATSTSLGALGGVFGAMIAQQLRGNGALLVPIVVVTVAVMGGIAVFVRRRMVHVELALPLCERHDAEWTEGQAIGRRLLAALVLSGLAAIAGALFDVAFLIGLGVVGFFGTLIGALVVRPARRYVTATALVEDVVTLAGVAPEAAEVLSKAARKKAKKPRAETP